MAGTDIGFNTKFKRGTGSGPITYTQVGEVTDISLPNLTRDSKDATHYQSKGGWKEFIPGLPDGGEVKYTIQFDSTADMATMLADFQIRTLMPYQVEWPDATLWEFQGFITSIQPVVPMDERMTAEVTIKISGKPAFMGA